MENHNEYVAVFKALGDETRLKIVEMLSCGELCACDILESFQITQPTLSYHMKILTESGLVISRKEGSWMRYSNNSKLTDAVKEFWEGITTPSEACICKNIKEINTCQ
ncbi:transcriptional regulator [Lacrimispora xylanolytica]